MEHGKNSSKWYGVQCQPTSCTFSGGIIRPGYNFWPRATRRGLLCPVQIISTYSTDSWHVAKWLTAIIMVTNKTDIESANILHGTYLHKLHLRFLGKVSKVLINNDKNYESLVKNLKGKGNRGLFVGNSLKIGTVMSSRVVFVQKCMHLRRSQKETCNYFRHS